MGRIDFCRNVLQSVPGKRFKSTVSSLKSKYDAIVVGAGKYSPLTS
jgi:hypothetical protein